MRKAYILEHGQNCTILDPCKVCQVENHLRLHLTPEDFIVYRELLISAVVKVRDEREEIQDIPLSEIYMTNQFRKVVLGAGYRSLGDLAKSSISELQQKGFSKYVVRQIEQVLRQHNITLRSED